MSLFTIHYTRVTDANKRRSKNSRTGWLWLILQCIHTKITRGAATSIQDLDWSMLAISGRRLNFLRPRIFDMETHAKI
jgi:hypothetical protein